MTIKEDLDKYFTQQQPETAISNDEKGDDVPFAFQLI